MGIFGIVSDGRRIGNQGWSEQNERKAVIIKICTKSNGNGRGMPSFGRIVQMRSDTGNAEFYGAGNNSCFYEDFPV